MKILRLLGTIIFFMFVFAVLVTTRSEAYQLEIVDDHLHSEYSDEGDFTKGRSLESIGQDLHDKFELQGLPYAGIIADHSDIVRGWPVYWRYVFEDWESRQNDINSLSSQYTLLPGEEVTVGTGNGLDEGGHLLVYGIDEAVPIPFVPPFNTEWSQEEGLMLPESVWDGDPARKDVATILDEINTNPSAVCYIAHPNGGYGRQHQWLDSSWEASGSKIGGLIKGMEIISGGMDNTVQNAGLQVSSAWIQWGRKLSTGQNVFVTGGSDDHNRDATGYPKIGDSFTYLLLNDYDDPSDKECILNALRLGHTISSAGPFVIMEVTAPNDPNQYIPGDKVMVNKGEAVNVKVRWNSGALSDVPPDAGYLVTIYRCFEKEGSGIEQLDSWTDFTAGERSFSYTVDSNCFIFAKVEIGSISMGNRTAYTSPIYLDPPGTERGSIDVALVIDCSGSMVWNDPDGKRKEAAKQFIDLVQDGDKIAVIGFAYDGYVFAGLREIQVPEDKVALKLAVDQVFSSGGTDIGEGLIVGLDQLNTDSSIDVRKGIIILTDGVSSYSNEHFLCRDAGVKVFTIGLGSDTNPALLQRIADETGGKYYSAPNADALQKIYNELSVAMIGGELVEQVGSFLSYAGEIVNKTLTVSPGTIQLLISLTWPGSDYDLTLIRPDGRELKPDSLDSDFSYVKGSTSVSYIVDHPEAGNWTCIITANEVPPGGENVELSLYSVKMTPPQVNFEGFADKSILNDPVTVTASVNDSDGFKDFIFFLDGYAVKYIPVSVADKSSSGSVVIDPTQLEDGVHWISASASDANWTTGGKELKFIVDNYLPLADAGPDQVVKVGEKVLFDGSNSKDSAYSSWEFGDGTTQSGIYPYGIHTYPQPGSYTVRLTVYDDAGNQSTDDSMVTVTSTGNTPPNIGEITIAPTPAPVNSILNANVYFNDPDSGDTHTATWDWGDGMNSPGTVEEAGYQVTGSHQYTTPGVYTIRVTVNDSGLGTGEALYQFVVIYDPEGGFVTGGGWINSPAGAYTSDSTLTGKAVFGFNSKYQRGANIPTGQTEFQFKVADLNFHSTIYDWLVISGSKAQYKGTGTINGSGEYGFMLSAIDGDLKGGEPDKFRIKIWDKATGTVVYDNQLRADENAEPSTTIDGGSIVIHKE